VQSGEECGRRFGGPLVGVRARPVPGWRLAIRNAFVAAVSAGVVAFLVVYALSQPEVKLETSIGSLEPRPGPAAVVHGRVAEANGDGVDGAQLTVARPGMREHTARSGAGGFFSLDVRGACGTYRIELTAHAAGQSLARRIIRRLCPGHALELDARVVSTGEFVWVPLR
jgi:hypothetical protein